MFQGYVGKFLHLFIGLSPLPVRVTTRIITFLVGNLYKPSFPLLLGGGTTQLIHDMNMISKKNTHQPELTNRAGSKDVEKFR